MTTFGELCCEVCGGKPQVLLRTGPKGPGCDPHWRCEGCLGAPPPDGVLAATDAIVVASHDPDSTDPASALRNLGMEVRDGQETP